jgi:hypothetical protein
MQTQQIQSADSRKAIGVVIQQYSGVPENWYLYNFEKLLVEYNKEVYSPPKKNEPSLSSRVRLKCKIFFDPCLSQLTKLSFSILINSERSISSAQHQKGFDSD